MSDFDKKRQEDNIRVLHLLEECLHGDGKHLRFCQLIEILNGHTDYFYEEPEATFERWLYYSAFLFFLLCIPKHYIPSFPS
ncbi:MAG: hypothetical protein KHX29_02370 [Prevotella buccalis]|nr:hypothetical protein [Hoylesella buccalis]